MDHEKDDEELVRGCLDGDTAACEVLLDRYEKPVFNTVLRLVRNREDALEISQNALLKAFQNLDDFDFKHRFRSWVGRIGINESLNFLKSRRRTETLDEAWPSPAKGPDRLLLEAEASRCLERSLMSLKTEYRAVVILRHFIQCSYAEIASILDIPEKTVKSRLFSARQMLREALEGTGVFPC